MPQAIDIPEPVFHAFPGAGELGGKLGPGVEHPAVLLIQGVIAAVRLAVVREAAAHPWRHVQPAAVGLVEQQLLVGVRAESIEAVRVIIGILVAVIAQGGFAVVIEGGGAQLLAHPGQLDLRQPFHRLIESVHPGLGEDIQPEIPPELADFHERLGLDILAVFRLEKVPDHVGIRLLVDGHLEGQIGADEGLVIEADPVAGRIDRLPLRIDSRFVVVGVIELHLALAQVLEIIPHLRPEAQAALLPVIDLHPQAKMLIDPPLVLAEDIRAIQAAVAGRQAQIALVRPQGAGVIREIHDGNPAHVQHRIVRLDGFARDQPQLFGPDFEERAGHVIRREIPVGGHVNLVAFIHIQVDARGVIGGGSHPELGALDAAAEEIVFQMVAHPHQLVLAQGHGPVRDGVPLGLAEADEIGAQDGLGAILVPVGDHGPVGGHHGLVLEIEFKRAGGGERFTLQNGLRTPRAR